MVMEAETPTIRLVMIEYSDLPHIWDRAEPLLKEACSWSRGAFTPESVVDALRSGEFKMIAMADGETVLSLMVISFATFASGLKVLECLLVAGKDMKSWLPYEARLDAYAKTQGCSRVRAIGRKPLMKMLPHWDLIGFMLEREIA